MSVKTRAMIEDLYEASVPWDACSETLKEPWQ